MSTTVDNKIVQMQFDNRQFEQGVQQSMSTLDRLKAALKFDKSADDAKKLGAAFDNQKFSGLQNGITQVQAKFSALDTIAFTVLQDMTRSAVNAGKNIVNALTIEPVRTGFQEYETQIGAIQTILSNTRSKGSTLEDVNNALDTLNTYADKTIYNFTEMTRNIGTFTAAGVGLEAATNSIQGIANLAAVSGSTSQQASTAMYQLSQALAAGTVRLQDWNSVVNAGMGGEVFQNALRRTSENLGTGAEEAIKTYGSFRESLTQGEWLTTEVLTETLNQFANVYSKEELIKKGYTDKQAEDILALGKDAEDAATKVKTLSQLFDTLKEAAQSGWTQSWEILVGDFEEARTLFTGISNSVGAIIDAQSKMRNDFLEKAFGEHKVKGEEWAKTMGGLYKDAYKDSVDDQKMFIKTSKLFGKDLTAIIKDTDAYKKAFDKGTIKAGDSIGKVLRKTEAFKEALESGAIDKKMLEGVYKYNNGIGHMAKNMKEAKKYQHELRDKVNETIKSGKSGSEMLEDLSKKGVSQQQVFANLAGKLKNAGTSYYEFSGETKKLKGYTKEETAQLYELKKALEASDHPMVELMRNMEKPSGRENVLEGMKNIALSLADVFKAVGKAWGQVFDGLDPNGVYNATESFRKFTEGLRLDEDASKKLTSALVPVFSVLKTGLAIVGTAVRIGATLFGVAWNLLGVLIRLGGSLLGTIGSIAKSNEVSGAFSRVLKTLGDTVRSIIDGIKNLGGHIKEFAGSVGSIPGVQKLGKSLKDFGSAVASLALNKFADLIEFLGDFWEKVKQFLPSSKELASGLDSLASKLADFINGLTSGKSFDFSKIISDLKLDVAAEKAKSAGSLFSKAAGFLKKGKDGFVDGLKELGKYIENMDLKFNLERLKGFLGSGVMAIVVLSLVRMFNAFARLGKKAGTLTGKVGGAIDELSNTLRAYQMSLKAEALLTIAKAVAIFAASIIALCFLPTDKLVQVTTSLSMVLLVVALLIRQISKMNESSASKAISPMETIANSVSTFVNRMGKALSKAVKLAAWGTFAIMLSIAIGILATSVIRLSQIPWQKALAGIGLASLLAAILVGAGVLLSKFAKDLDAGFGVAMLGFAAGIYILVGAVKLLGSMDVAVLQQGLLAVGALALGIALLSVASGGNKMITLATGMLILSVALLALIPALLAYSLVPWGTFGKGVAMIGIFGVVMALVSSLASQTIGGAISITILAGALILITPILLLLGAAAPIAAAGVAVIAAAFATLIVAAIVANIFAAELGAFMVIIDGFGAAALMLGASVALIGAGMLLGAMGIEAFGHALPAVAEGLAQFGAIILAKGPQILAAVAFIIAGLAAVLIGSAPILGVAAVACILGLLAAITAKFPEVLSYIGQLIYMLFAEIPKFLISGIDGLARALSTMGGPLMNAVMNLIKGISNLLLDMMAEILEEIPVVGDDLAKSCRNAKAEIEDSLPPEDAKKTGEDYTNGLNEGVEAGMADTNATAAEGVGNFEDIMNNPNFDTSELDQLTDDQKAELEAMGYNFDDAATDANESLSSIGDVSSTGDSMKDIGSNLTKSFENIDTSSVSGAKDKITGVFDSLPSDLGAKGDEASKALSSSFEGIDTSGLTSFKKDVNEKLDGVVDSTGKKSNKIKKNLANATKVEVDTSGTEKAAKKVAKATDNSKDTKKSGKASGEAYSAGVESGIKKDEGKVKTASKKVADGAAKAFKNKKSDFKSAGTHCMGGVVEGLKSKLDAIKANAISAANTWNSTYKSHQKIKSPSRVTMQLGAYTMMGLVKGMDGKIRAVRNVASETAYAVKDTLTTPLTAAMALLDNDIEMSPVITPVVDASQVAKGASAISGMFANTPLNVGSINTGNMVAAASRIQNGNTNADVVSAINKLRGDIGNIQGNTYNVNGVTYDDGANIHDAIGTLIRATVVEGRA